MIEILISVAILATATVFILQAFARGAYALALAKNRFNAYAFASAKMADLELGFSKGVIHKPEGQFRIGKDEFQWRVEASPVVEDSQLELVTLTVGWQQGRNEYESRVSLLRRLPEGQS